MAQRFELPLQRKDWNDLRDRLELLRQMMVLELCKEKV